MSKKEKLIFICIGLIIVLILGLTIWAYSPVYRDDISINVTLKTNVEDVCKMYYATEVVDGNLIFSEEDSSAVKTRNSPEEQTLSFLVPSNTTHVRFDLAEQPAKAEICSIKLNYKEQSIEYEMKDAIDVHVYQDVTAYFLNDNNCIEMTTEGNDAYVVWDMSGYCMQGLIQKQYAQYLILFKIVVSLLVLVIVFIAWKKRNLWSGIPKDLYANRKMIWSLSKTDFKQKYSASYFGVVWAFVQPIVTIAIYVFVFQIGFKAGDTSTGYPFLLYLVSGIIPWFFFAEGWMNATNSLVEYDYLVKKVVFKISVLPIVKIISSLFVHLAFIGLALLVFTFSGKMPGVQIIQIVYYLLCTFALILALAYFTSAIIPFFRDLAQIINIVTQLGMWTLPIMYDEAIIGENVMRFLRFNPMYYVVTGYRDAFMHGQWFWERTGQTIYFWTIVLLFFAIGFRTFRKLRIHFADVL